MTERNAPRDSLAPTPSDHNQRELIRSALDTTLLVEAAAGTGKTTALVGRIVAVLATGLGELDRMAAVTFTEAAAGELKLRIRSAIERARLEDDRPEAQRARLRAALPKLEEARVGTIHGFCSDLLREHPIEAGVDPYFEVASDDVTGPLFERAFDRWFDVELAAPGPAVRRILRRRKREFGFGRAVDEGPRGVLRRSAWQLIEHRDFPTPWRRPPAFNRDEALDTIVAELKALAEWAPRGDRSHWFGKALLELAKAAEELERTERSRPRDYDGLEAWMSELIRGRHWNWKGYAKWRAREAPLDELRNRRDDLSERIRRFIDASGADIAPQLRDELWPVVEAYEAAKQSAGCLDFHDLLIHTRNLIRDQSDVRNDLQRQITHYFVDEFQDTDPLQVEILMLLAGNDPTVTDWQESNVIPGKLFIVGDPKQSIYRFRRADVELYRAVQRRLVAQGAQEVRLQVSFRSAPQIQDVVNAALAPRFESQGPYVALAKARESFEAQPAVVALPVPAPYGKYKTVTKYAIEESLPDVAAAWIQWLVNESGWTVTERERPGERVKVEPRHVCLLFRNLRSFGNDASRPYVEALEARELPHLLVGGNAFHSREEIETLTTALAAIERPEDELTVFATLKGPLFALSDASLFLWRERIGALNPVRKAAEEITGLALEVSQALAILKDLHRGRNHRPVADTIARLLEATRAHAAFAIWPTGMQALANIGRFLDLARRAERRGLISFRSFVEHLEEQAESGEVAEAALLEEGVQGVRMMTAHKAKGLEFPVVILVDMTSSATYDRPSRFTDPSRGLCAQRLAGCTPLELSERANEEAEREREEAIRLLYVASTRARDLLVVPVIGDGRQESWLSDLYPAIYPSASQVRRPIARQAPGTPLFGSESVLMRSEEMEAPDDSVMPGLHQPEVGTHSVAWWDPSLLKLGLKPTMGLAQEKILAEDTEGRASNARGQWASWLKTRSETLERGAGPSVRVSSATTHSREVQAVAGSDAVAVIDARWMGERPAGPRFGTLIHAAMATVEFNAKRDRVQAHVDIYARLLGATEGERIAALEVVIAALGHPLLSRAAAARAPCLRESPIAMRLEDGSVIEGVPDLAFEEADGWTVIDFKTDANITGREVPYRKQVALYAQAITAATKKQTTGCLLLI
jgi:ATP-dependent helicase/nuclease subunit A